MNKFPLKTIAIAAVTAAATCSADKPKTTAPRVDELKMVPATSATFIASDVGDGNMGGVNSVYLGKSGGERRCRMLLGFGIPTETAGTDRRVVLRLNWRVYLWWAPDNVIRVRRILRAWGQGRGNYGAAKPGEATWNSARHGQTPWEKPGCAGAADRTEAFAEREAVPFNMDFDVTKLYRNWVAEGRKIPLSFLVEADGEGQVSTHPRGEYIAIIVGSGQSDPPGAALLFTPTSSQDDENHGPLWSQSTLDAKGEPKPTQFGMVADGVFYGSSYNGHVYKIDLKTGKLLADWFVTPSGCYSAPLLVDGKLFVFGRDKKFYQLIEDPKPRAVILADYSKEPKTTRVESLAYDPEPGLFFLGTGSSVHAVDATGAERWSVPHPNEQWGEPMACDGALYTYDTDAKAVVKYLTTGPDAPRLAWKRGIGALNAELAKGVDGDGDALVFVSGWKARNPGTLTAIHDDGPKAGEAKWGPIKLPHPLKHCSIWEGRNLLLLPAQNGYVECRNAATGEYVRRIPIPAAAELETPWSQVTISGPHALVATHDGSTRDNHLYVFDIASGRELCRSAAFDGAVGCMMPVVSEGIAVIGTYPTGAWHAFRVGEGEPVPFSRFGNARHNGSVPGALTKVAP